MLESAKEDKDKIHETRRKMILTTEAILWSIFNDLQPSSPQNQHCITEQLITPIDLSRNNKEYTTKVSNVGADRISDVGTGRVSNVGAGQVSNMGVGWVSDTGAGRVLNIDATTSNQATQEEAQEGSVHNHEYEPRRDSAEFTGLDQQPLTKSDPQTRNSQYPSTSRKNSGRV